MWRPLLIIALLLAPAAPTWAQDAPPAQLAPAKADPAKADPVRPPPVQGEVSLAQTFSVVAQEAAPAAPADPVAAAEGAGATGPTVGSLLRLTLSVTRPRDTTIALPEEQATGRFELLQVERAPLDPNAPPGAPVVEVIHMTFAVYRPGRHVLEPFEISILDADGGVSRVKTAPVEVKIDSVTANMKDPQMPALRAPVSVWIEDWTLVWILGTAGALLVAGLLGALLYRALRPEPPPPPPPPPRPAHEVALEKLAALRGEDLLAQGEVEAFYVRLSGVIREYLGRRYNLSLADKAGLELTTSELVALLREIRWPRGFDGHQVQTFLYDCDIVKFARHAPSAEEADALLAQAFGIVERTQETVLGVAALGASPAPTEGGRDA